MKSQPSLPIDFSSDHHPVLYHYTSVPAALAMVQGRSLWLSEFTAMNDPSEFNYARQRLLQLMADPELGVTTVPRVMIAKALEDIAGSVSLLMASLTTRRDDLNQWRLYGGTGGDGAGCVVGLDARFLEHDAGVAVRTVLYEEGLVDTVLKAALRVLQDGYEASPTGFDVTYEYALRCVVDLFSIKHPGFADEREVRLSRMVVRHTGRLVDVGGNRTGGGSTPVIAPFERIGAYGPTQTLSLPLITPAGDCAIRCVGLGPTLESAEARALTAQFEALGIETWRSNLPFRR